MANDQQFSPDSPVKLPWFRFYSETVHDPKVQRLTGNMFKFWVNCLCLAAENDGELPSHQDIAWVMRIQEDDCLKKLTILKDAGLIDDYGSHFKPHNWNIRQYKSDRSTERVQKFRERFKKRSGNVSETLGETPPEQIQIQIQNQKKKHTQEACAPIPLHTAFSNWLKPWPRVADEGAVFTAWSSVVHGADSEACAFAARDRYLASEEVSRGIVMAPEKFLFQQGRNGWNGKWPLPVAKANNFVSNVEKVIGERLAKGDKPW